MMRSFIIFQNIPILLIYLLHHLFKVELCLAIQQLMLCFSPLLRKYIYLVLQLTVSDLNPWVDS